MKTTIASILVFTGFVLYFGVEKPQAVDVPVAEPAVAMKVEAAAAPVEFTRPTTILPRSTEATASSVERTSIDDALPVAALSPDALKAEIETLQQYVTRENAIARLNEGDVSTEERAAWGKVFERLLALRSQQLRLGLEQAQAALESYKTQHEERVASYTDTKS